MPVDRLEKAPMKTLFSFCLMTASSADLADTPGQPCETFAPTDKVSAPLTIAEIERENMATLSEKLELRSDYPQVPFGFINAKWWRLQRRFNPAIRSSATARTGGLGHTSLAKLAMR